MILFVSIMAALLILGILSWKDLNERSRSRHTSGFTSSEYGEEDSHRYEREPQPPADLTGVQIVKARRLYVSAFWVGIAGNLLLSLLGLVAPSLTDLASLGTWLLLLIFLYASFRILRVLGYDPLTSALLCLLPLVPFFALIQFFSISQRCKILFGPLQAVPDR